MSEHSTLLCQCREEFWSSEANPGVTNVCVCVYVLSIGEESLNFMLTLWCSQEEQSNCSYYIFIDLKKRLNSDSQGLCH